MWGIGIWFELTAVSYQLPATGSVGVRVGVIKNLLSAISHQLPVEGEWVLRGMWHQSADKISFRMEERISLVMVA